MSDSHKKTILIDGDVHPTALSVLEARDDVELAKVPLEDAAALAEAATGANGILARSARITPELIASANGLQVVSRHGVGYDRVNVEALSARKIPLTVTGTANSPSVAEHAMMFMLACAKRLRPTDQRTREGDFLKARQELGRVELLEKKVLIIGFGRIGKIVARRCQGFDMEVLACDPYIDQQAIRNAGVTPVENFRDVLSDIDYLTIHVPLSDETENLIGAEELAQREARGRDEREEVQGDQVAVPLVVGVGALHAGPREGPEEIADPAALAAEQHAGSTTHTTQLALPSRSKVLITGLLR